MNRPLLALIGEAWGAEEELAKRPFVGAAGALLNSCLVRAGIDRGSCFVGNVFNLRPDHNKLETILTSRANRSKLFPTAAKAPGHYLPESLESEVLRLHEEIRQRQPEAIVTLGGTALWAFTGSCQTAPHRGHLHYWEGIPLIPTHHPARVLRQYKLKVILTIDLIKTKELINGTLKPAEISGTPEPTLEQLREFAAHIRTVGICCVDIENLRNRRAITSIGLGTPDHAVCVPLSCEGRAGNNYWATGEEELAAYSLLKELLEDPAVGKIFHHGAAHDIPYLAQVGNIYVRGAVIDTKVQHAVMFPEMGHSLSDVTANWFLFPPWKAQWASGKDSDVAAEGTDE